MLTLSTSRIAELLESFLEPAPATLLTPTSTPELLQKLNQYLDLLLRWNARTNLTAIRDPEQIVPRHFGESLFAARHLASHLRPGDTVLDFGSGAGFPGLPLQLLYPELRVTLAESQGKKASFLREAARTLGTTAEIWAQRVDQMPPDRHFAAVTLRAVDNMPLALIESIARVTPGGWLAALAGDPQLLPADRVIQLPASENRYVLLQHLA